MHVLFSSSTRLQLLVEVIYRWGSFTALHYGEEVTYQWFGRENTALVLGKPDRGDDREAVLATAKRGLENMDGWLAI